MIYQGRILLESIHVSFLRTLWRKASDLQNSFDFLSIKYEGGENQTFNLAQIELT